uniref:Uncharacterized protein n=1 Tax=Stomoxys calcitrans TaxID=35570 RepID=A0A1I8P280_STOCA|nr:unnamed protein product [Stomoxys calcitrans]
MFEEALGPLNLVQHSALKESLKKPPLNVEAIFGTVDAITQKAAALINADTQEEFLYKNPNGWKRHSLQKDASLLNQEFNDFDSDITTSSSLISSDFLAKPLEPWALLEAFHFPDVVRQITQFIETWELTPATKFVVIAQEKSLKMPPFGERYFVEVHFSKPTPKCPNPLARAKSYFQINVSCLLPRDYPVNVTYRFEGYSSCFYALGPKKMSSNKFQRFLIDTIIHMKLAFYAQLEKCERLEVKQEKDDERKIHC